jgi:hypothetical protein
VTCSAFLSVGVRCVRSAEATPLFATTNVERVAVAVRGVFLFDGNLMLSALFDGNLILAATTIILETATKDCFATLILK